MGEHPPRALDRFAALVEESLGFHGEGSRAGDLGEIFAERVRAVGAGDAESYLLRLASPSTRQAEMQVLGERLAIGETYFFREPSHLDALIRTALPARRAARGERGLVRILSVGCSTGEEPYSMAIAIQEALPEASPPSILAIDLSTASIERARRGRYADWALRATSLDLRARWFRGEAGENLLSDSIRGMVSFEQKNLFDDDPSLWAPSAFDVIFCRNMLMYFSAPRIASALQRLGGSLAPGGFLFLGSSETARSAPSLFEARHEHEAFFYVRTGLREAPSAERPRAAPARDLRIDPPPPAPAAVGRADAVAGELDRVLVLFEHGRFAEALAMLEEDPPRRSADPEVVVVRATILTNQGRFREAEEALAGVPILGRAGAQAHYLAGICREHEGAIDEAIRRHRLAVMLDPSFSMPHLQLGLISRRRGDTRAARAALHEALRCLPREGERTITLFGGGFRLQALLALCRAELDACGRKA